MTERGLRTGVVALLDILGARELLNSMRADAYIASLREIEKSARTKRLGPLVERPMVQEFAFFSDTLVYGLAAVTPVSEFELSDVGGLSAYMVRTAIDCVTHAIASGHAQQRPFTYRGCIAFGDFLMDGHFFIGPAINEAAEWYEKADAGVAWLLPSAAQHVSGYEYDCGSVLQWDVPMKDGKRFKTWVVNPLISAWRGNAYPGVANEPREARMERAWEARKLILETFGRHPRVEVAIKRQHTESLLRNALERLEKVNVRV